MSKAPPRALLDALQAIDVQIDGDRPWDVQVRDSRLWKRITLHGTLGLGEAYVDGWWDCEALDELFFRVLSHHSAVQLRPSLHAVLGQLRHMLRGVDKRASRKVGLQHYDLGNDFFSAMLDPYMQYSCAYFTNEDYTLQKAQEQKLNLICRKLQLQPGERVLDIGCGWGGLARYMATEFDCAVTGITISQEQAEFARKSCTGLPVDIRRCDYRDIQESFDKVVSVGMFEHVGWHNYRVFMESARRCVKDDGLMLLHTIGCRKKGYGFDPWIERYIFPHSALPAAVQIANAADGLWTLEDWHNFGTSYDPTLRAWHQKSVAYMEQHPQQFDERFARLWRYYLLSCAGAFRARSIHLWQLVLSPHGVAGGYRSVR